MIDGLLHKLRRLPCTVAVVRPTETFTWTDAFDSVRRRHRTVAFVRREDGQHAFVDVFSRASLRRDPELRGSRRRIELECLARGARYEIWTEDEIWEDPVRSRFVRVADAQDRTAYEAALGCGTGGNAPPSVVSAISARLGLQEPRPTEDGWVGRASMTGILMALALAMDVRSDLRMPIWQPFTERPTGNRACHGRDESGPQAENGDRSS